MSDISALSAVQASEAIAAGELDAAELAAHTPTTHHRRRTHVRPS